MINDRKVIEKGAGLTNMSRGRGMASLQGERTTTGNFGRLAQSLGVGLQAVTEKHQERADIEAMNAYKKAQHSTIGKSPEEQRKALSEARAGIQSGDTLSFFDKMLTDESQSVQVWDKLQAKSMGKKAMASADRFRAENPNLNEYEMKQGIANILQGGLQEANGISEFAGNMYMQHSSDYIDNLDQTLTKQFVAKRNEELTDGITTGVADDFNSSFMSITGLTEDDLLKGAEDPDHYDNLQKAITPENTEALAKKTLEHIQEGVSNLTKSGVRSGKEARELMFNSLEASVLRTGNLDLFDKVVTTPQKGSGNTMMKASPEAVQEARERLATKLARRDAYFSKLKVDIEKSTQLKKTDEVDQLLGQKLQDVVSSGGDPEAVTLFNKEIADQLQLLDTMVKDDPKTAGQAHKMREMISSYQDQGVAKEYYDNPKAVERAEVILTQIRDSGMALSYIDEGTMDSLKHHMNPQQEAEYLDYKRKRMRETDLITESVITQTQEAQRASLKSQRSLAIDYIKEPMSAYVTAKYMPADFKSIGFSDDAFDAYYSTKILEISDKYKKEPGSLSKVAKVQKEAIQETRTHFRTLMEEARLKVEAKSADDLEKNRDTKPGKPKAEEKKVKPQVSSVESIDKRAEAIAVRAREIGLYNEDQIRAVVSKYTTPSDIPGGVANYKAFVDNIVNKLSIENQKKRGSSTYVPAFGATF